MANRPPRPDSGPRLIKGPVKPTYNPDDRIPPHDNGAEESVIGLCLLDETALPKVTGLLKPGDFYSGALGTIFDAILKVGKGDVVLVLNELRKSEKLAGVGGSAELTRIQADAGAHANILSYAEIVRRNSRERMVLRAAHLAVAELYARTGKDSRQIFAELRSEIDVADKELTGAAIQFLDDDALFCPDPPADLIVPSLGLGKGPAHGFFGQGFAGKSVVAFSMGLAVASGRPIWGTFRCKQGIWVHLDHEQGKRRTKGLIQRMCLGMGISREEIHGQIRASIYPSVNLTSPGAFDHYCRAFEGVAIATCDALKGMTPGIDENDSAIREFIDMLGIVSERTGCMIVLIHHAGKTPMDGSRPRKESGRGSSGIFDACQSVWVMSAKKGEPTMVTHEKDRELGYLVEDFGLRIEDVETGDQDHPQPRGGLRVVHLDREQLRAPQRTDDEVSEAQQKEWLKTVSQVKDAIKKNPGKGTDAIREIVRMKKATVIVAITQLKDDGDVVDRVRSSPAGGQIHALYLRSAAPPEPKPN